ncbi:MAG: aspartyl/Asparaginyl beta-hydroxylase family protein [Rhodoferax sp.]|nr:aspartyl/Asparaginyl beta-hydroxylase family protein [Rhodoferax sp.]
MKWMVLGLYAASIAFVHFRGRERHRWLKQVFDHSAFLAPLNALLYMFSSVPTRPYLTASYFPDLKKFETHWPEMLREAEALRNMSAIKASEHMDDAGFNSFFKEGWTRFYLHWYGVTPASALRHCPLTVELIRQTPGIKAALFAELPAGAKLNRHRDPYAGSLRYHLGLATPNDDRCCIWVDGERYSWRDGDAVLFDETYIHWVHNGTDQSRLILLCDVERPLRNGWMRALNRAFARHVMRAATSPNEAGEYTGPIGRLFRYSFLVGQARRRFKRWNPMVYKVVRALLILGLAALVIMA